MTRLVIQFMLQKHWINDHHHHHYYYIQLKLLPSLVYSYSWQCSYFAKKKQKWWSYMKKHAIMDPVWDPFPFYMRTVQSQTGKKVTCVRLVTNMQSDRSEFIFSPVNAWKEMYGDRYELIPVWVCPGLMSLPLKSSVWHFCCWDADISPAKRT